MLCLKSINSPLRIQRWVRGRKITHWVTHISPYSSVKWNAPFSMPGWPALAVCRTLLEGRSSRPDRYHHLISATPLPLSSHFFVASTVHDLGHTLLFSASNIPYAAAPSQSVFSLGDEGFRGLELENRKHPGNVVLWVFFTCWPDSLMCRRVTTTSCMVSWGWIGVVPT